MKSVATHWASKIESYSRKMKCESGVMVGTLDLGNSSLKENET